MSRYNDSSAVKLERFPVERVQAQTEQQQLEWLDTFLRKMNDYPSDKFLGVIIYELLDQPDYEKQLGRYHGESHFGLVTTDANNNPSTPKAAYYHVQKLLGVYKGENG